MSANTITSDDVEKKVYKHVATIHCSGNLSFFQRKIINCLIYNAFPTFTSEDRFQIGIRELLSLMGLSNNNYQYLREAFRGIRKTEVTWNLTKEQFPPPNKPKDEGKNLETWVECSWLSWTMSDGSTIHYEFPAPLKECLKEPAVYAAISLEIQKKLTSKYSLVLYENCVRYVKIGKTKTFPLETFKSIMGVENDQYKEFRSLNNRVIKPAIKQVNDFSDIFIKPTFKRRNKRITAVQFSVNKKLTWAKNSQIKKNLVNYNGEKTTQDPQGVKPIQFFDYMKKMPLKEREEMINAHLKDLKAQQKEKPNNEPCVILEQYKVYGWSCRLFWSGMYEKFIKAQNTKHQQP